MEIFLGIATETWNLLREMAPYLLLGFAVAGLLHVLIPADWIERHLSGSRFGNLVKAALFGVPLPLCSCGVIPVAAHLQKSGASRGSVVSFLVSTPTTGVDSILATYSLLGPLFALFRPIAAFVSGITAGGLTALWGERESRAGVPRGEMCTTCGTESHEGQSWLQKLHAGARYAFYDLVADVGRWILIGVVAGGLIAFLVPSAWIETYLGRAWLAYPLMLLIATPMYVCATGSIPIAAALVMKGMTPGAGLIFLIAGPATNTATLAFVGGKLGRRTLILYLTTIVALAFGFGLLFDGLWTLLGRDPGLLTGGMRMLPEPVKTLSAVVLLGLIVVGLWPKKSSVEEVKGMGLQLKVPDMTCGHCKAHIQSALLALQGVKEVRVDLKSKLVEVEGPVPRDLVVQAIRQAGYSVEEA